MASIINFDHVFRQVSRNTNTKSKQTAFDVRGKVVVVLHSYEVQRFYFVLGPGSAGRCPVYPIVLYPALQVISLFAEPQKAFHKCITVTTLMGSHFD